MTERCTGCIEMLLKGNFVLVIFGANGLQKYNQLLACQISRGQIYFQLTFF